MDKNKTPLQKNADKQRRFREKQKAEGKKLIRGYVSEQAQQCYEEIGDITGWTDSEILNNALRITFAAYKCGQIKLLTSWLKEHGH